MKSNNSALTLESNSKFDTRAHDVRDRIDFIVDSTYPDLDWVRILSADNIISSNNKLVYKRGKYSVGPSSEKSSG